jgi:hypothetical protein
VEQAEEQGPGLVADEGIEESLVVLLVEVVVVEEEAAELGVVEIALEVGLEAQGRPWEETALEVACACEACEALGYPCWGLEENLEETAWVHPTGTAVVVLGR